MLINLCIPMPAELKRVDIGRHTGAKYCTEACKDVQLKLVFNEKFLSAQFFRKY